MKPAPFAYHRPDDLEAALAVLAELGDDGKVLAGGQSLLPVLSMRLASPGALVDVNRLTALAYVRTGGDAVRVGALARHADVERDEDAARAQPLLRQALRLVAHPVIRNRGTTVGSLAHADPSGEMTAVLALLGGTVELASARGRRTVAAEDFFVGPLESAVRPGELAVEAAFPVLAPRTGTSVAEVARRHGDYAVCGVAALVSLDEDGAVTTARAGYLSMGPVPTVLDLTGAAPDWAAAGEQAARELEAEPDIHATAAYRRHLARVLTARALGEAHARASAEVGVAA